MFGANVAFTAKLQGGFSYEREHSHWSDLATWGEFFAKYGKRYGLMREFHENGIC